MAANFALDRSRRRAGGGGRANVRSRPVSPVAPRPREGPLTEPTAGAQPWPRERVLMPRSRHSLSAQKWPSEVVGSISDHGGSSRCTYRSSRNLHIASRQNEGLCRPTVSE